MNVMFIEKINKLYSILFTKFQYYRTFVSAVVLLTRNMRDGRTGKQKTISKFNS